MAIVRETFRNGNVVAYRPSGEHCSFALIGKIDRHGCTLRLLDNYYTLIPHVHYREISNISYLELSEKEQDLYDQFMRGVGIRL